MMNMNHALLGGHGQSKGVPLKLLRGLDKRDLSVLYDSVVYIF